MFYYSQNVWNVEKQPATKMVQTEAWNAFDVRRCVSTQHGGIHFKTLRNCYFNFSSAN